MIKCENISKIYKTKDYNIAANKNISLEIKDGEIVWVAGVSGAGKSTLLHILSSIDIPTEGAVYWNDKEVSRLSDRERSSFRLLNIGLILQSLELLKTQSVFDNVALPLKFLNESSSNINKKVNEILENLKIDNLKKKKPEQLSGGQKQRVAIARALVSEAPYIFGDEISANLDTDTSKFIYEYIRRTIKRRNGIGFFISHDELIENYADTKYIMRDGGLILNI
ncbi:ABC transporter ATP-binding protein [Brachyspira hampsonii]|uniref:ABC transporter ATP-binding protein n=1 Tax=Brachyspira hampsonii TaxID=1287055 RepID=A0A1E5NEE2_9SPIR|nr:ABC transporter ATP-binding protein [Brachyspira hampsonii]OEJ14477.1 ABC transporter ATP-binding protein [Brachyspira hampsonii]